MKKLLLIPLMMVLVACMCTTPIQQATQLSSTPQAGQDVEASPEVTPTPAPTLSAEQVNARLDEIQDQVMELRGLTAKEDVIRDFMTTTELQDVVTNDFFKDYTAEEAASDVRELSALGLLEPGFDLYQLYVDLYAEQVAGFYDPETKEMYVVRDEAFTGLEAMTFAHEYTHALQDQTYDMRNGLMVNEDYCETHTEYCAGVQALTEGDASLSEQLWFYQHATDLDRQQVMDFYNTYESPVYDSAPYYLQQDFLFPYSQGLDFATALYSDGGFPSIDAAFRNPPQSTEQILHPEKYPSDVPVEVDLADMSSVLGAGWEEVTRNTMGEWYTYLILSAGVDEGARLPENEASAATAGWDGDTYTVYWNESTQQFALVMRNRWESSQEAQEFAGAFQTYAEARWGVGQSSGLRLIWDETANGSVNFAQRGTDTLWIIAPDADTAQALFDAVGDF